MIGIIFRSKRLVLNKSINEVASDLGLDKYLLMYIEDNKLIPKRDIFITLCKYYGIDDNTRDYYLEDMY